MKTQEEFSHPQSDLIATPFPTTRRQMLRLMAASLTIGGGIALTSCGQGGSSTTNVELKSTGWPIDVMPSKSDQAKDPKLKVYAEVLDSWLKKNPGVTIKKVTVDIWNSQALSSSITAGTAPSWYPAAPVGSFAEGNIRTAMVKGLMADITDLNQQAGVKDKLAGYVKPYYDAWKTGDRYYVLPYDYIGGGWVTYYRRDLFAKAGVPEPKPDWTWSDFRTAAAGVTKDKVKGVSFTNWGLYWLQQGEGWDYLTRFPSPSTPWHWKYDYLTHGKRWTDEAQLFRNMFKVDKSVSADSTLGDNLPPFRNGEVAMVFLNTGFFTTDPKDPNSFQPLADKEKMTTEELIGMVPVPSGTDGSFGTTQGYLSNNSLYPRLSKTALEKAHALYLHIVSGDGYYKLKSATYQQTKDLRTVYSGSLPAYNFTDIPGVPGKLEDAFGKKWYQSLQQILSIPVLPNPYSYFPAEKNSGPTNDAESDANSAWMFTDKPVQEVLQKLSDTRGQQAQSLSSSIPADQFKEAAKRYYADLDAFWKKNAPKFYQDTFQPWYQQKVLPAIQ